MILSIFPYFLNFQDSSPVLLRLTIGAIFILWSYKKLRIKNRDEKYIAIVEGIIGLSFIVGLYTQIASLMALIILGFKIINKIKDKAFLTDGINYYLILFVIALSILFTGPGRLAFDLPL